MNAQIISIGNELLIGDIVNTNAAWMGRKLTEHFITVNHVHTIPDEYQHIYQTLDNAMKSADVVLITGGLGPTKDDITKRVVADYFQCQMRVDEPTLAHIKGMFKKLNITFSKSNYGQAEVPENCEVMFNEVGTAPGMWFDKEGVSLAVMPGVPGEMRYFMNKKVMPRLTERNKKAGNTITRYYKTAGVGESTLSDMVLEGIEDLLTGDTELASLPNNGGVTLRLTARAKSLRQTQQRVDEIETFILNRIKPYLYARDKDTTLSKAVGQILEEQQLTIATAESCTGGLVSSALTKVPGSSAYTLGGIVAYANSVKQSLLGVKAEDLETRGAVSKQVALQMAAGVAGRMGADIGVSTTGIAGPGGGTEAKPVGTVWMGFKLPGEHFAVRAHLHKNREYNRKRTVKIVLETLRRRLQRIDELPYGLEKEPA